MDNTPIKWLIAEQDQKGFITIGMINEAEEMFKQAIIKAYGTGEWDGHYTTEYGKDGNYLDGEDYYNKTFK